MCFSLTDGLWMNRLYEQDYTKVCGLEVSRTLTRENIVAEGVAYCAQKERAQVFFTTSWQVPVWALLLKRARGTIEKQKKRSDWKARIARL